MGELSFQDAGDTLKIWAEDCGGPQGQEVFVSTFIPPFRMFADVDRSIYYPHYFSWMGEAREMSVLPVLQRLNQWMGSGRWGLVTNSASVEVVGETMGENNIVCVRMWSGLPSNASVDMTFDWWSMAPDGPLERIALGRMKTTWVEVLRHGSVKPAELPSFYADFLKRVGPQYDAPDTLPTLPEPLRDVSLGETLFKAKQGPRAEVPLATKSFETSQYHSNIVSNIYFSNYAMWLAKMREHYFWSIAPQLYVPGAQPGVLKCLHCAVHHLREVMPFEVIEVTMALRGLYGNGVELYFEFFRKNPDGTRTKVAYGDHRAAWMAKGADGRSQVRPLPPELARPLRQAATALIHA
ncbi:MAG: hypothetical protein IPK66_04905 [Rhodospirillales bacterium]|nr:hypothetical protein [Rhodospirillales bacterium]